MLMANPWKTKSDKKVTLKSYSNGDQRIFHHLPK
jgi:hypothetical protein